MNTNTFERVMEWGVWGIYGLLIGLIALGSFRIYKLSRERITPRINPPEEPKSEADSILRGNSLKPVQDFFLVKSEKSKEQTDSPTSVQPTETPEKPTEESTGAQRIQQTKLPLELVGTTTGNPPYNFAVVRNLETGKVRVLREEQVWKPIELMEVQGDSVVLLNRQNNRREVLVIKGERPGKQPR